METEGRKKTCQTICLQGVAGGAGTTTIAVNLASELSGSRTHGRLDVCLIDLDIQFGAVASHLRLPLRDFKHELVDSTDLPVRAEIPTRFPHGKSKLSALTAYSELVPLELISEKSIKRLISTFEPMFDCVIIDLPRAVFSWTNAILDIADIFYIVTLSDTRSEQNVTKLIHAIHAERISINNIRLIINYSSSHPDSKDKKRAKHLASKFSQSIVTILPYGGKSVRQANDKGETLRQFSPLNPMRRKIKNLASSILEQPTYIKSSE